MMADPCWDHSLYEGLARTEYVYDASVPLNLLTTAPWAVASGTGSTSIDTLAGGAPRFVLAIGAGTGVARQDLPGQVFLEHVQAVMIDVEGVRLSGSDTSRPKFKVEWYRGTNMVRFVGDELSSRIESQVGTTTRVAESLGGNVFPVPDSQVGLHVDYGQQFVRGHMGWAMTELAGVAIGSGAGTYSLRLQNEGSTAHTFAYARVNKTIIWKRVGPSITYVYPG